MEYILDVLYVLTVIAALLLMIHFILSAKRLTRFTLVFQVALGVILLSFGLIGLFYSPSSRSCFVAYFLLVFLFFGTSLILFLRGGEANEPS